MATTDRTTIAGTRKPFAAMDPPFCKATCSRARCQAVPQAPLEGAWGRIPASDLRRQAFSSAGRIPVKSLGFFLDGPSRRYRLLDALPAEAAGAAADGSEGKLSAWGASWRQRTGARRAHGGAPLGRAAAEGAPSMTASRPTVSSLAARRTELVARGATPKMREVASGAAIALAGLDRLRAGKRGATRTRPSRQPPMGSTASGGSRSIPTSATAGLAGASLCGSSTDRSMRPRNEPPLGRERIVALRLVHGPIDAPLS